MLSLLSLEIYCGCICWPFYLCWQGKKLAFFAVNVAWYEYQWNKSWALLVTPSDKPPVWTRINTHPYWSVGAGNIFFLQLTQELNKKKTRLICFVNQIKPGYVFSVGRCAGNNTNSHVYEYCVFSWGCLIYTIIKNGCFYVKRAINFLMKRPGKPGCEYMDNIS